MEVGQRHPRVECPAFLAFVRRKPCAACGAPAPSQAAHLRTTDAAHAEKRPVGIGEKPDDRWCNPLCASCHLDAPDAQHKVGELKFWARVGVDPFENSTRLWNQFCRRANRSPEQREAVVKRATSVKRAKVRREKRKTDARPNSSGFPKRPAQVKRFAESRPLRSRSTFPPKGSRKFNRRNAP